MNNPADKTELAALIDAHRDAQLDAAQSARLAALGFMVAGVCHEVANPLTAIHSMVQLLQSSHPLAPETLERGLENIAANVQRVLNITRTLNEFSRAGNMQRARINVNLPVANALQNVRQRALFAKIQIKHGGSPDLYVLAVPDQIEQVFTNILLNAAQAMDGDGCIVIASRQIDGNVEVSVRDSGPGIAPGYLPRLFEPFFTTKPTGQGTGLGLAISNEIAIEHGGSLRVENHPDGGACAYVTLPAHA